MSSDLTELITKVRENHTSHIAGGPPRAWCVRCSALCPCDAIQLSAALVAAEGRIEKALAEGYTEGWNAAVETGATVTQEQLNAAALSVPVDEGTEK